MLNWDAFEGWAKRAVDWTKAYHQGLRQRPVRPQVQPGSVQAQIPATAPEAPEAMQVIMDDFERLIVPNMTHWQHPRFFAYFPANAAPVSVLAEQLVSGLAAQCMLWQTSPAATELETAMMVWLREALGLSDGFSGVIQDSASSATLAAVLMMRSQATDMTANHAGLAGGPQLRVYCSDQVHSSIDKAMWVAGLGQDNLVKLPTKGPLRSLDPEALAAAIARDRAAGHRPAGVIICVGGTSVGASDQVAEIVALAKREGLLTHLDAAWAGSAMICPENRVLWDGVDGVDSLVFNPHKWLGAQFDCAVQFVRSPTLLVKTLGIQPEYLKTHGKEGIINYSEWSVPLGRRFRALKLWFLLRAHGLEDLRARIRNHIAWSHDLADQLRALPDFEISSEPVLSLFSFRYMPQGRDVTGEEADALNLALVNAINDDGRIYLTQTKLDGRTVIRFQAGQFQMEEQDKEAAFEAIVDCARKLT